MKVWLTKYALSVGIFQLDGNYAYDGKYFTGNRDGVSGSYFCKRSEVFVSKDDAEKDFYARRAKKISSLEKQITKLEKAKAKFVE